jgi:hypothetical protein
MTVLGWRWAGAAMWIASEICYYLGLTLAVLLVPGATLFLWFLNLIDRAQPNYWMLLIVWAISALMFLVGVGIKRAIR